MPRPEPDRRQPTMEDVARAAGLSRSTVSRVFTDGEKVSPDAQIKVREAAAALGYVPNLVASELAGRRPSKLGLLIRDATNPAYGHLHDEMNRAVDASGRGLVTATAYRHEYGDAELRGMQRLLGMRVAGLFVSTGVTSIDDLRRANSGVPMLVVGRPNSDPEIESVSYDERAHGRMMADHVAAHGHRRVAVLTAPPLYSRVFRIRSEAFAERAAELGMSAREIELLPVEDGVVRALEAARAESLTCIVCPVDYVALELLRAARRRGDRVPEDVSVVGFDGLADGLDLIGLTTLAVPVAQLAREAVARMLRRLDEGLEPAEPHGLVRGRIVEGATLARI